MERYYCTVIKICGYVGYLLYGGIFKKWMVLLYIMWFVVEQRKRQRRNKSANV
jgi:hypothetical protein